MPLQLYTTISLSILNYCQIITTSQALVKRPSLGFGMSGLLWFFGSVSATIILITLGQWWSHRLRSEKAAVAVWSFTAATIMAAWLSPLYYEFPNYGQSHVVSFEDGAAVEHPFGAFCWEFGDRCINVPNRVLINAGVTSLTSNPKVRRIGYVVKAEIVWPERFYAAESRRKTAAWTSGGHEESRHEYTMQEDYRPSNSGSAEVAKVVLNELFKFNSAHSTELAEFDNPLDVRQNNRFGQMLLRAIAPPLAQEGLRVTFERFTIE